MAAPGPNDTVADALARRVVTRRRGPAAFGLADGLRELGAVDRAVYEAVARTPTGNLDVPVRRPERRGGHRPPERHEPARGRPLAAQLLLRPSPPGP
ncbi:MAG TPA: hypothetical protein VG411_00910, partial [Actinomycetota bacterium]|nr:hypothetical protein [Actinomycetota bacterium]